MIPRTLWFIETVMTVVFYVVASAFAFETPSTIPQIVSKDVRTEETHGFLVYDVPPGGIMALSFPHITETTVRQPSYEDGSTVHALSGPDLEGRIVYVEDHMMKKRHSLKVLTIDGKKQDEVFTHSGDALWDHAIGKSLALSTTGSLVALLGPTMEVQMNEPMALLMEGMIEIWNIEDKTQQKLKIAAIDRGLSWFPEAKKLAYCAFAPREEILGAFPEAVTLLGQYEKWDRIPTVFTHDLISGESKCLLPGWYPCVSPDGKSMFVVGLVGAWAYLLNLDTMKVTQIYQENGFDLPIGYPGNAIGFLSSQKLMFYRMKKPSLTKKLSENLPFVDRQSQVSIEVLDLSTMTSEEVTVIEPHLEMSLGLVKESAK